MVYFLVLWARLVSKERAFPCTLGTFSVKESVSLYFGYVSVKECFLVLWVHLALKRVFPCALGTFSVKKRECVSTSASVQFVRCGRERESISLCFGHDLVSKSVSLYFGYV
jgi:hypothetical protein